MNRWTKNPCGSFIRDGALGMRFIELLKQKEAQAIFVVVGFLLLSWPVVSKWGFPIDGTLVAYLFALWAGLILALFLKGRVEGQEDASDV